MMSLLSAPVNNSVRITKIAGGRGVRQNLARFGIGEGSIITVKRNAPFSGPMMIDSHGSQTALGRGVAAKIFVEVLH